MKANSINGNKKSQHAMCWLYLSVVSGFQGPDTDRSIFHTYPIVVNHKQNHIPTSRMICTSGIRGCVMCLKLLQREPCKAALNSKSESGMGKANSYKSLTTTKIAMLWAYWDVQYPKGKIPNLLNCG